MERWEERDGDREMEGERQEVGWNETEGDGKEGERA